MGWSGPANSADWGYEDPQPATPLLNTVMPPASPTISPKQQALTYWLQLCSFVSPQTTTEEDSTLLKEHLLQCLDSPQSDNYLAINIFWPKVRSACQGQPDLLENYRDLFRSLFRLLARRSASDKQAQVLAELLGPSRIAVAGNPPLTEDAINAYADMACFVYEQQHPGKSLDAADNRFTFAQVVRNKFTTAPTTKDKLAMINFDLSWAKFKILWSLADQRQKQLLLAQWQPSASNQKPKASAILDLVLNSGPWADSAKPKAKSL